MFNKYASRKTIRPDSISQEKKIYLTLIINCDVLVKMCMICFQISNVLILKSLILIFFHGNKVTDKRLYYITPLLW